MRCSFTPYEGKEKYIFVSYAHKDGDLVKPILEKMYEAGFRIWYDDGIELGTEYSEYIAKHLENCAVCLVFHSQKSKKSRYCKDEIYYALNNEKGILSIYLEDVNLSSGLKMRLGSYQSTFWYQYLDADRKLFYERLLIAEILQPCKREAPKPDHAAKNTEAPSVTAEIAAETKEAEAREAAEKQIQQTMIKTRYRPFPPYEGKEKYIFASYAHKDGDRVKPILEKMYEAGFRIWYDVDIEFGKEWAASIAKHIQECAVFLVFNSQHSKDSDYCKREIYYASNNKKDILSIYLDNVVLTVGLQILLSPCQSISRYQYSDKDEGLFFERLMRTNILQPCKVEIAEDKIVKFHDADFEKAFRKKYSIKGDITEKTILNFTYLTLDYCWLSDISDIAMFKNLTSIDFHDNKISDILPLAGLVNLTELDLGNNEISDIAPLAGLVNLTKLNLVRNQISDITPLAKLVNLTELNLWGNQICDIKPLAGLVNLTVLDLDLNQVSDITPLARLVNLTELHLWGNQISGRQQRWLKTRLPNTEIS